MNDNNKTFNFLDFILGPSISFKRNNNDRYRLDYLFFITLGIAILGLIMLFAFRTLALGWNDIISFISSFLFSFDFTNLYFVICFVASLLLFVASLTLSILNIKKHVFTFFNIVAAPLTVYSVFYIIWSSVQCEVTSSNVMIWMIMNIPTFIFIILLLVFVYRSIHKTTITALKTNKQKEEYFRYTIDSILNVLKIVLNVLKTIGLSILNFFKNIGIKFFTFLKNIGSSFKMNTIEYYDKKDRRKDRINVAIIISFVFSFVFFYILKEGNTSIKLLGDFFICLFAFKEGLLSVSLFISFIISLAFVIFSIIYLRKKHFYSLLDSLSFLAFVATVLGVVYIGLKSELNSKNIFLFIVMEIPTLVFLFTLFIRIVRLFTKLFNAHKFNQVERENDYNSRIEFSKTWTYRFGNYMKKNWGQLLVILALITLAVAVLYPLLVLLLRSFKLSKDDLVDPFGIPDETTFENYAFMWSYLKDAYLNSLITTISVTIGTIICASVAAFAFIRFRFPLKSVFYYMIIGLMMIPGILTLISRYSLVQKMGMVGSLWGIILPGIAGFTPMAFMLLFTFFKGIPKDLFEAADMDGATDFSVFYNVVVPLSKPIISTIAIQTFVGEWNDYLWAYLIVGANDQRLTLPILLQSLSKSYEAQYLGMSVPFAGYVLSAIPLVLIFIVASKQFIQGLTSGAFKM